MYKKFFCSVLTLLTAASLHAATYSGNGAAGFGGSVGNGILTVTSSGNTVTFSLQAPGGLGDNLALFIDSTAGGFTDTSTFTDTGDSGRRAISGFSVSGTRTTASFATGFAADYAFDIEAGTANLFSLNTGSFGFVASGNLTIPVANTYQFTLNLANIGLTSTGSFKFVASLSNGGDNTTGTANSVYRSNETIGTSTTVSAAGASPNAGLTGTVTFSNFNTFVAVPEPSTIALVALGAVGLVARFRKR